MPFPDKEETQDEYVARFMSDEQMKKDYPNQKQRLAVAYQHWRDRNKKKK